MARDQETVEAAKDTWVELTNGDVTEISFQVLFGEVEIRRHGAAMPTANDRGWIYSGGSGERLPLSEISRSNPGARVWAKGRRASGSIVLVDHA